jgi:hypothetical protein
MLEHYLNGLLQKWMVRGGESEGEPLWEQDGWELRLNGRSVAMAFVWLFLFAGAVALLIVVQFADPQPVRQFVGLAMGLSALALLATYNAVFHLVYGVRLTGEGISLHRFLLSPRELAWSDVSGFRYSPGDELLKVDSREGPKKTLSLYLTLNGLAKIREGLASKVPTATLAESWAVVDPVLLERVPSWRSR